jgi:hypothetical protein
MRRRRSRNEGRRARLTLFLSVLLLAFFIAEASHHHGDGVSYGNCPFCIAAHSPFLMAVPAHDADLAVPAAGRITLLDVGIELSPPDFSLPIIRSPTA